MDTARHTLNNVVGIIFACIIILVGLLVAPMYAVYGILLAIPCGILASNKGRSVINHVISGLLLEIFGLIIILCLRPLEDSPDMQRRNKWHDKHRATNATLSARHTLGTEQAAKWAGHGDQEPKNSRPVFLWIAGALILLYVIAVWAWT